MNETKPCEHPGRHRPHPYKEHPDEPPNRWRCPGVPPTTDAEA